MYQYFIFYCQFIFHPKDRSHFTYPLIGWHLGCFYFFQLPWLMLLWTFRHKFLCDCMYPGVKFPGHVAVFIWLRNCHCFPVRLHHSIVPPEVTRAPVSLHPGRHVLLSIFFVIVILMDAKWCLAVVLICSSLGPVVTSVCSRVHRPCVSSLEKCLLRFLTHFWLRFCPFIIELYILDTMYILYTFYIQVPYQTYDL